MTIDALLQRMESLHATRRTLTARKNHDYASAEDAFANFVGVSAVSGLSVPQVFVVWLATKVIRLGQLVGHQKSPNNESVLDTLVDLANYADLCHVYLETHPTS